MFSQVLGNLNYLLRIKWGNQYLIQRACLLMAKQKQTVKQTNKNPQATIIKTIYEESEFPLTSLGSCGMDSAPDWGWPNHLIASWKGRHPLFGNGLPGCPA